MNYWKVKTDDLLGMADERGIILETEDKSNRKMVINLLKIDDLDKGESDKTLILNDKDEIVELDQNIATLKQDTESEGKKIELVQKSKVDPKDPYRGVKMMRCIFRHRMEGEPGYVELGSNGRQFYVPKDMEVTIPAYLKAVIDTAVEDRMESITRENGKIEQRIRSVPRIAWEFRGYIN